MFKLFKRKPKNKIPEVKSSLRQFNEDYEGAKLDYGEALFSGIVDFSNRIMAHNEYMGELEKNDETMMKLFGDVYKAFVKYTPIHVSVDANHEIYLCEEIYTYNHKFNGNVTPEECVQAYFDSVGGIDAAKEIYIDKCGPSSGGGRKKVGFFSDEVFYDELARASYCAKNEIDLLFKSKYTTADDGDRGMMFKMKYIVDLCQRYGVDGSDKNPFEDFFKENPGYWDMVDVNPPQLQK